MTGKAKLTPAEWEIMQAVWAHEEAVTVRDVLEHLYPGGEKAYTTVQTVMNTLVKKNLLVRKKIGPIACYNRTLIVTRLPKTRSGKILRRVLRQIAAGEEYSVPSTIDDPASLVELEPV